MSKTRTIKYITTSDFVKMGDIDLRQPLPSNKVPYLDPFILLHHYGPYTINAKSNPFDLGPHPHRGFEPITFLFKGEQLHRDSLGNEEVVKAGDVQWTTAGQGIVHAEGPTKEFVERGGELEGIQLWLNLPASKKMMPANYQLLKSEDMSTVTSEDGKIEVMLVSGELENKKGKIETQTEVNSFVVEISAGGSYFLSLPKTHNAMVYLISGQVEINNEVLKIEENQFIQFNNDGEGFQIDGSENAKLLVLSGEPLNEALKTYGPFVMNTQSELIEAMNDYQAGKMGHLNS